MRTFPTRPFLIAGLLLSFVPPANTYASDTYDVGISVVDITPDYPIRLNGFGNRREESEGVSQPIHARAMAISQGDQPPLVLVVLDSLGIRTPMVDAAAARLAETHNLPRKNLAVTFSHSHCTPKVNGACDNIFSSAIPAEHQKHIDQYTKALTNHIATAAAKAIDSRKPATLHWAVGEAKFAKNRRDVGGPVDHDLPMLVVKDSETGQPRAIYVSYACHAVTLSFNQISGDWPGYAAAMIERQVPGVTAMVSIGAGSDQNPVSGVTGDKVDVAAQQGVEIATDVKRLLEGKLRPITGQPSSVLNSIYLPLNDLPTREQLVEQTGKGRPTDKYNATTQLARLDRGEELISKIDYPIQTWTFGDSFCMTFLAGEVCVDYALRLKKEIDRERFWLNTYSNDFCSYIPSERLAREGRYGGGAEVPYFALPATLKAGLEQKIVDEVHRQVPDSFEPPDAKPADDTAAKGTQGVPPKAPEDSLNCIQVVPGLKVAVAAAEPNVSDPVAIDFGADGRLWVAEMNDYGQGVYETFQQTGRIRWLKDADNDGQFETAGTFVDGLRFPTDVKVWRDGVLICDAPDILFARDEDGDGKADSTEKLFSGFEIRNAQARVNSLRWGLDNWVYGAGGLFGGNIVCHKTGQTVDCSNRDFRINPDSGEIQAVLGRTQQGRSRNDRGDWFGCSNGTLVRAISSDESYAARNPLSPPATPPGLSVNPKAYQLMPPENLVTFELSGAPGRATSACGLGIYRDVALGQQFHNDTFTCEPVHQSVHRIDVSENGHGFTGQRGTDEDDREFLSSTDRWFRPVQARTGPDGALWVVDMYRYVIEHSRWIPQSTLAEIDVHAGKGRGRIYRVTPAQGEVEPRPVIPNLQSLSNAQLVTQLDSPNGIVRDLAHQMLLWRNAEDATPELQGLVSKGASDFGRIHALAVLDGLQCRGNDSTSDKKVLAAALLSALKSGRPEVQRFAVRLSEQFSSNDAIVNAVLALVDSNNVRVRRQVALSVGSFATPADQSGTEITSAITRLLSQKENDNYVRSAALSSVTVDIVDSVLMAYSKLPAADQNRGMFQSLDLLAARICDLDSLTKRLPEIVNRSAATSNDVASEILTALDARSDAARIKSDDLSRDLILKLYQTALSSLAKDEVADVNKTIAALKFVGRRSGAFTSSILKQEDFSASVRADLVSRFLSARFPVSLQKAAASAIASMGIDNTTDVLLEALPAISPEVRSEVVSELLALTNGPSALLASIKQGAVRPELLDASQRGKLLNHSSDDVRLLAKATLGAERETNRTAVVASLQGCLDLPGDAKRGEAVFRKRCSSCHKLKDHGFVVGPDLQALTNRDPKWLLTTILDPNKEVDARYVSWTAATTAGRTASGMIVEESANEVRLRESGGKEHVIRRADLDEFRSSQKSVMPEGLEKDMTPQNLSDVIAFVASLKSTVQPSNASKTLPRRAPEIAPFLLDETQPVERRQQAIDARPGMGPAIISLLVADLPSDATSAETLKEEYRRIPWIWRVALAVGKRNDGGEIRDLLEVCVPRDGQPLRDWQAVVIGGGIINGLSQQTVWPRPRIDEVLSGLPAVKAAWPRTLQLASEMADNTAVKPGTRYDALRMVALRDAQIAIPQLKKYLTAEAPNALQMGAVSGLADINSSDAASLLTDALKFLTGRNRELAVDGLRRSNRNKP